jgi:hypothetical protein
LVTGECRLTLLRLAYLGITNAFGLLRLLPGSDGDKAAENLCPVNDGRKLTPFRRLKTDPLRDLGLLEAAGGCWSWPPELVVKKRGVDDGR